MFPESRRDGAALRPPPEDLRKKTGNVVAAHPAAADSFAWSALQEARSGRAGRRARAGGPEDRVRDHTLPCGEGELRDGDAYPPRRQKSHRAPGARAPQRKLAFLTLRALWQAEPERQAG